MLEEGYILINIRDNLLIGQSQDLEMVLLLAGLMLGWFAGFDADCSEMINLKWWDRIAVPFSIDPDDGRNKFSITFNDRLINRRDT